MTAKSVFTIPAGISFVDALAHGVINDIGTDPFALSDCLILLPNRRACRALREGFLRVTEGQPLLLPEMRPIGEADEDAHLVVELRLAERECHARAGRGHRAVLLALPRGRCLLGLVAAAHRIPLVAGPCGPLL